MNESDTYLVTLQFDAPTFEWLQALRCAHFPPLLNQVPAHLTLLHTVSNDQIVRLKGAWQDFEGLAALTIPFTGVKSLGRGTALVVQAPQLEEVRRRVMQVMSGSYSAQDRQRFRPHVTVQNKVSPAAASALHAQLCAAFTPREGRGLGLMIWRYLAGPWSLDTVLSFRDI